MRVDRPGGFRQPRPSPTGSAVVAVRRDVEASRHAARSNSIPDLQPGRRGTGLGQRVIQRLQHIVFATIVMPCSDTSECQRVELEMGKRGFQLRSEIVRRAGSCVCSFVREHAQGAVDQLRDAACSQLEEVATGSPGSWRGYVQVCGTEGAWATLVPGKPPVLGSIEKT